MKKFLIFILALLLVFTFGCTKTEEASKTIKDGDIQIVDDTGKTVVLGTTAKRIISLYSAHTENLFALGLDDEIIGVGKSEAYPPRAMEKDVFDYESDPEKVIAANPDLVLIRPFINSKAPKFVEAIEKAGIPVVSLYPESFEQFDGYMRTLSKLTGKEKTCDDLMKQFHLDIDNITKKTANIEKKIGVYFESTEVEYRTVTSTSMAALAIEYAGGINIAKDALAVKEGSSIGAYGAERILEKAEQIDVFVSQNGAMNSGGNPHSISIRPGFNAIKAVRENRVYNINEKLVSSPTFRFSKGVTELARMFYPEVMDDLSEFNTNEVLTREKLTKLCVLYKHKPIFSPTSSSYNKKKGFHTYGEFSDIDILDTYFDYIETAVQSGYIESQSEVFEPKKEVTRDELARSLYMLTELSAKEADINIADISQCKVPNIVKLIVGNNIMSLQNENFEPEKTVLCNEALEAIKKLNMQ